MTNPHQFMGIQLSIERIRQIRQAKQCGLREAEGFAMREEMYARLCKAQTVDDLLPLIWELARSYR